MFQKNSQQIMRWIAPCFVVLLVSAGFLLGAADKEADTSNKNKAATSEAINAEDHNHADETGEAHDHEGEEEGHSHPHPEESESSHDHADEAGEAHAHEGEEEGHSQSSPEEGEAAHNHAEETGEAHDHEEGSFVELSPGLVEALGIKVMAVERKDLTVTVDLYGWIRPLPENVTEVKAFSASMVEDIQAFHGDEIQAGSPLATLRIPESLEWQRVILTSTEELDCMEISQTLLRSEGHAEVIKLLGDLRVAAAEKRRLENEVNLIEQAGENAVSKRELNTKRGELQSAKALLDAKRALALAYDLGEEAVRIAEEGEEEIRVSMEALPPEIKRQIIHTEDRQHELETQIAVAMRNLRSAGFLEAQIAQLLKGNRAAMNDTVVVHAKKGGVVVDSQIHHQDALEPGELLFRIIDCRQVQIAIEVPEVEIHHVLRRVRDEIVFRVVGLENAEFTGKVQYFDTSVDAEARKAHLVLKAENGEGLPLREGMAITAGIPVEMREKALSIPRQAVITDGLEKAVFVEDVPGCYQRIPVRLGAKNLSHFEAVDGIREGDRVVTMGSRALLLGLNSKAGGADAHAGHNH